MGILDDIVAAKKKRIMQHKEIISADKMKKLALNSTRQSISFFDALSKEGLSIIGEFKKASPSMGVIDGKINLTDRIDQYNASVDAISVLTEEDYFNGSVQYLKEVRSISKLPIIRKDFIIDEYQIYEAKVIGADCILLIAAILQDKEMERFYRLAYELGMDVLLEVHNEEELDRALALEPKIVGVNNRNLKDFTIDLNHTERLSKYIGDRKRPIFVSESGVSTNEDIKFLKKCRVDGLLIGRAFMESERPMEKALAWKSLYALHN